MEKVIVMGDLSKLQPAERAEYYTKVCLSMGLNPMTRPFEYITLNGKLTLYARKDATDQLRTLHKVSIFRVDVSTTEDCFEVLAYARDETGREDVDMGAAPIVLANGSPLRGEALINAKLKAITKAKRRVTLSLCGLGWLDETEIASIPAKDARPVTVTVDGEIVGDGPLSPGDSPPSASASAPSAMLPSTVESAKLGREIAELAKECGMAEPDVFREFLIVVGKGLGDDAVSDYGPIKLGSLTVTEKQRCADYLRKARGMAVEIESLPDYEGEVVNG